MSNSDAKKLRIECFNCSKVMTADESLAGKFGQCPRCGSRIKIPTAKKQPPSTVRDQKPDDSSSTEIQPPAPHQPSPESDSPQKTEDPPAATMTVIVGNALQNPPSVHNDAKFFKTQATWAAWFLLAAIIFMGFDCLLVCLIYESEPNIFFPSQSCRLSLLPSK